MPLAAASYRATVVYIKEPMTTDLHKYAVGYKYVLVVDSGVIGTVDGVSAEPVLPELDLLLINYWGVNIRSERTGPQAITMQIYEFLGSKMYIMRSTCVQRLLMSQIEEPLINALRRETRAARIKCERLRTAPVTIYPKNLDTARAENCLFFVENMPQQFNEMPLYVIFAIFLCALLYIVLTSRARMMQ